MNDKNIIIKARNSNMLIQGIVFLVLSVISLIIALMPFLSANAKSVSTVFFLVGGTLFAIFMTLFVILLVKECKPANALILSSRGFIDLQNIGSDIVIEWTNVAAVKLLGKKEMPYLGITLENTDIVIAEMKKKEADEMRENIEENLPHILISQKDVRTPLKELKDTFVKFVREARILNSDSAKATKNNPFTTDDVLRAFGKLPFEPKKEERLSVDDESIIPPPPPSELFDDSSDEKINVSDDNDIPSSLPFDEENDPFYELLKKEINSNIIQPKEDFNNEPSHISYDNDTQPDSLDSTETNTPTKKDPQFESEDIISDEMKELMSRARSSKISELEKILNEKDVPTTHLMPNKNTEEHSEEKETGAAAINLSSVLSDDAQHEDRQQIVFDISSKNEEEIKAPNKQTVSADKHDDMADTKEYFPDLVYVNDSFNSPENDNDGEFIIPDPIEYDDNEE